MALMALALVFFAVGVERRVAVFVPTIDGQSASQLVFKAIVRDLAPEGVVIAASSPLSPFTAQMAVSLFLAFVMLSPVMVYATVRYVAGALESHERRVIYMATAPASLLFIAGVVFSYYLLLPITFNALYSLAQGLGVPHYFFLEDFITTTLGLLAVGGFIFLIPVIMPLLTFMGVVPVHTWVQRWRTVLLTALIFAAIITPDGSGISMVILSLPIFIGYFVGLLLSRVIAGKKQTRE